MNIRTAIRWLSRQCKLAKPAALGLVLCCLAPLAGAQDAGFSLLSEKPALRRSSAGNWDSAYLDPGAVIFHEDAFHLLYVAIPRWPHPLAIGYAKSTDGYEWQRQSESPVLTHDQTGALPATSIIASSAFVAEDGTWVLYFTSVASGEAFYGQVARATALGPLGPWAVDPEPVLVPGPDGAWDGLSVGDASVVPHEDGYAMYYTGFGNVQNGAFSEKRANIGMATSDDGVTWQKFDDPNTTNILFGSSDPVLAISEGETSWDTYRVVDPNVQKTHDGWLMAYRGATFETQMSVGLATSPDGVNWQRVSDKPELTGKDIGKKIFFMTLLSRPDHDYLFMELGSDNNTDAYLATRSVLSE
ncbi:hypothetical protein [Roseovarius sp. EL26]|uniref:hypothetical protein n=1 Tax=Roseovarius sp. EL26 TaxID=2126672 RepID=UPI000EA16719|nr:hypothetical protein [Roseovarius sp. EL26]